MNLELFDNTKVVAYFIWERTKVDNALSLWYCAEDIANFLERFELLRTEDITNIIKKEKSDFEYIQFVRHLSYRIHVYTKRTDQGANWYDAEYLMFNAEWVNAVVAMANIFATNKDNIQNLGIRCDKVKEYYGGF